ncbi:(2Fe-2S) ferredoxin domain-containing protein [Pseudanabaena sp. PCC 6802]|uniref:(2Fe-2S) ferredoxin domain-containing protein n=1 Tax=Pseudanabaena sp. PCC 6802 TaxID=118173 RepID=UPI0003458FAF|nr:(2Fe-2S) ferredoxin domain-containing protein [Pseudanabaena sp. PCC 6802]
MDALNYQHEDLSCLEQAIAPALMCEDAQIARQVFVCQNRTCRKDGSERILAALKAQSPANVEVIACGCLGLCGAGPMILVTPENMYYWRVRKSEVPVLIEQHLIGGKPVKSMLHPRLHLDRFA